jgi:hypothetical protein
LAEATQAQIGWPVIPYFKSFFFYLKKKKKVHGFVWGLIYKQKHFGKQNNIDLSLVGGGGFQ